MQLLIKSYDPQSKIIQNAVGCREISIDAWTGNIFIDGVHRGFIDTAHRNYIHFDGKDSGGTVIIKETND
jgi:hypothetical protein